MTGGVTSKGYASRGVGWVPFVLFGVVGVAATPLYLIREPSFRAGQAGGFVIYQSTASGPDLFGAFNRAINGSEATPYYWLAAFFVVFGVWPLISHRFERGAVARRGRWAFPVSGVAAVAVLFALSPWVASRLHIHPVYESVGTAYVRGFLALLVVAASLLALAAAKGQTTLIIVALAYVVLALLSNAYDVENQAYNLGMPYSLATTNLPNLLLPSGFLVVAGSAMGVASLRGRPRPVSP